MGVTVKAGPGAVNLEFWPSNPVTIDVTGWPVGSLAGRTFTANIGAVTCSTAVIGDAIHVEATEAQTATVTDLATWKLTETTGGASIDLVAGKAIPTSTPVDPSSTVVAVSAGAVEVALTVTSSQSPITQLAARTGTVVTWPAASAWTDLFDATAVSNPTDSTPVLTATGGYGVATHGAPENANAEDRRIYFLEGSDCSDCEVRLDWEIVAANTQVGIALRGDDDTAVVVWSNIVFSVNANLLLGVWEYDGVGDLLQTNQFGSVSGYSLAVSTAFGDGTTVTVRTRLPHAFTPGSTAALSGVGSFGNVTVAAVPSATSFTFTNATAGSWSGGTVNYLFTPGRRKVAVRLIGNTLYAKQWLPTEDEPAWDDATHATSASLPATLIGSGGPPPSSGRVGVVVAHLGTTGQVKVGDLEFHNLDPLDGRPASPVADDDATLTEVGLLTARVDDLRNYPTTPSPRLQNLVGWAYDPVMASASTALTSGVLYLVKIPLDRESTISNVLWGVSIVGVTATAGQNFAGVYSPAGVRLGQAGVDADVTVLGLKTTAITPVVVPPGFVWAAFLFNASTGPALARAANNVSTAFCNAGLSAAAYRFATRAGPATSLPTSFTPSTNALLGITPWAGLS